MTKNEKKITKEKVKLPKPPKYTREEEADEYREGKQKK